MFVDVLTGATHLRLQPYAYEKNISTLFLFMTLFSSNAAILFFKEGAP